MVSYCSINGFESPDLFLEFSTNCLKESSFSSDGLLSSHWRHWYLAELELLP